MSQFKSKPHVSYWRRKDGRERTRPIAPAPWATDDELQVNVEYRGIAASIVVRNTDAGNVEFEFHTFDGDTNPEKVATAIRCPEDIEVDGEFGPAIRVTPAMARELDWPADAATAPEYPSRVQGETPCPTCDETGTVSAQDGTCRVCSAPGK